MLWNVLNWDDFSQHFCLVEGNLGYNWNRTGKPSKKQQLWKKGLWFIGWRISLHSDLLSSFLSPKLNWWQCPPPLFLLAPSWLPLILNFHFMDVQKSHRNKKWKKQKHASYKMFWWKAHAVNYFHCCVSLEMKKILNYLRVTSSILSM